MLSWLTNSTKRRIIQEIRNILSEHPRYKQDAQNVQNKYSFQERPARGVIVDGTSGDRVVLSADNYMGRLNSFVMLAPVNGKPNTTVEWVRENFNILEQINPYRKVFPSPPGAYYFKVLSVPDDAHNVPGEFTCQPIITVYDEEIMTFGYTNNYEAQLSHTDVYPGSVRLFLDRRRALIPGVDFAVDYENGSITFLKAGPFNGVITADYRFKLPTLGPIKYYKEHFDVGTIPGATIAFGDRCQIDDEFVIIVTDERTDVANVYGGKFEISFDILAFSKDSEDREKLSDYIIMKILERQNALGFEGFELLNVSPGGENEDVFNPDTDEYYYDSNISLQFRVDWSIFIPLPIVLWRAEMISKSEEEQKGYLDGTVEVDLVNMDPDGRASYIIGNRMSFERVR